MINPPKQEIFMHNFVQLIGRVAADGNSKSQITPDGHQVCHFDVATNEKVKNKQGEYKDITTWHHCVAWGNRADFISKYIKKGALIMVNGSLKKSEPFTRKDGMLCETYYIQVQEVKILSQVKSDENTQQNTQMQPQTAHPPQQDDLDNDVPF